MSFQSKLDCAAHLYERHAITPVQYGAMCQGGGDVGRVLENYFMCRLCDQQIVKDGWIVSKHMEERHRISLYRYAERCI